MRQQLFLTKYPEALAVATSAACIAYLQVFPCDVLCLDYDLAEEDTGMAVVEWLVRTWPRPKVGQVVIHSTNLLGSLAMLALLRQRRYPAEYVPFRDDPGGPFHL